MVCQHEVEGRPQQPHRKPRPHRCSARLHTPAGGFIDRRGEKLRFVREKHFRKIFRAAGQETVQVVIVIKSTHRKNDAVFVTFDPPLRSERIVSVTGK